MAQFNCLNAYVATIGNMYKWIARIHHYRDVITSAMASQITGVSIVCSVVCSGANQRKHQSSASLTFVREIHWWPVNSLHEGPVTRKMFPFDDVIMLRHEKITTTKPCARSILCHAFYPNHQMALCIHTCISLYICISIYPCTYIQDALTICFCDAYKGYLMRHWIWRTFRAEWHQSSPINPLVRFVISDIRYIYSLLYIFLSMLASYTDIN